MRPECYREQIVLVEKCTVHHVQSQRISLLSGSLDTHSIAVSLDVSLVICTHSPREAGFFLQFTSGSDYLQRIELDSVSGENVAIVKMASGQEIQVV